MKFPWRSLASFVLVYATAAGAAQSWPERPVRLIVPFAPGGATDIVARILAPALSESLGQQFVVDNRTGANGNIAIELAARAQPDGYTILVSNVSTSAINPTAFASMFKVDPIKSLTGVTLLGAIPNLLVAGLEFPAQYGEGADRLRESASGPA